MPTKKKPSKKMVSKADRENIRRKNIKRYSVVQADFYTQPETSPGEFDFVPRVPYEIRFSPGELLLIEKTLIQGGDWVGVVGVFRNPTELAKFLDKPAKPILDADTLFNPDDDTERKKITRETGVRVDTRAVNIKGICVACQETKTLFWKCGTCEEGQLCRDCYDMWKTNNCNNNRNKFWTCPYCRKPSTSMEGEECPGVTIDWNKVYSCCDKRCNAIGMRCRQIDREESTFFPGMGVTNSESGQEGIILDYGYNSQDIMGASVWYTDNSIDSDANLDNISGVDAKPLDFLLRFTIPTNRLKLQDNHEKLAVIPWSQIFPRASVKATRKKNTRGTTKRQTVLRGVRGEDTTHTGMPLNTNCRRFRDQYMEESSEGKKALGLSIQTCQQAQSETLLANLEKGEHVTFYWDVENYNTMDNVINGKGDSYFNSVKDSFPLPRFTTKWFPGIINNIRSVGRRDGTVSLIEILVHDEDTYHNIRLPGRNRVYEYYDGYLYDLDPRYITQRLTWSIDFSRMERESIVTLCINPRHVMANSHWYGLPWNNGIWERSLPIRLESN